MKTITAASQPIRIEIAPACDKNPMSKAAMPTNRATIKRMEEELLIFFIVLMDVSYTQNIVKNKFVGVAGAAAPATSSVVFVSQLVEAARVFELKP